MTPVDQLVQRLSAEVAAATERIHVLQTEAAIAAWIDDKLVGFTQTYFEVYFTEQYQKQSFETDRVMNIRCPRAFAPGKKEYQRRTFYLYRKESLRTFQKSPSQKSPSFYAETR